MRGIAREILSFLTLLVSRFIEHRGLGNAASLTYSTLLSLVPLLTVVFAVLSAFPVADRMGETLQDFLFRNFVPAAGQAVQAHIEEFIARASQLSGTGFLLLIVIALMMMISIDNALNAIWETRRRRGSLQKFLVYWALITLGPLLLAISLAATSYLVSLPFMVEAEESLHLGKRLILFAPILASMTAFSLIYLIIPNHAVPLRYAFAGGLIAAILFDLANRAFGIYITSFANYQAIYGALAVIPIFLVWIFLSWVIFLLGAEFACCLERCLLDTSGKRVESEMESLVNLLTRMRDLQHDGQQIEEEEVMDLLPVSPDLVNRLAESGVIIRTEEERWALGCDLRDVTLRDLYRQLHLPMPQRINPEPRLAELAQRVDAANDEIDRLFSISLDALLREAPDESQQPNAEAGA